MDATKLDIETMLALIDKENAEKSTTASLVAAAGTSKKKPPKHSSQSCGILWEKIKTSLVENDKPRRVLVVVRTTSSRMKTIHGI